MAGLPVVRAAARMLDQVPLEDQSAGAGLGVDSAVGAMKDAPDRGAADPAPRVMWQSSTTTFVHALANEHRMLSGVLQLQPANDDVVRRHLDAVVVQVEHVDHGLGPRRGSHEVPRVGRAGLGDPHGLVHLAARQVRRLADRESARCGWRRSVTPSCRRAPSARSHRLCRAGDRPGSRETRRPARRTTADTLPATHRPPARENGPSPRHRRRHPASSTDRYTQRSAPPSAPTRGLGTNP